jgi:hypothetical protein
VPLIPTGTETSTPSTTSTCASGGRSVCEVLDRRARRIHNVLNSSTALAVRSSNFGTPTYHQPGGSGGVGTRGAIPYARFIKFEVSARW